MRFKVYEYDIPGVCYIRPQTWKRPSAKDYADVDPSNLIGEVEICNNDIRFTYDSSIIAPKSQMKSLICLFDPKDVQDMKITDEIKMDVLEASKFIEIEPSETPKHIYVNLMCGDQEIVYEDRRYVVGMSHSLITDEPLQRMVTKQGESPLPVVPILIATKVPIFIATNKEKAPSLETKFTDEKSISVSNGDQKKEDDSDSEIELYAYGRRGSGVITVPDASKFVKIEEESDSDDTDKYDDDDEDDDEDDDDDSGSEDMSKEDSLHQARIRTLLILTASHLGKRKAAINCNNKTAKMMKYEEEEEEEDE